MEGTELGRRRTGDSGASVANSFRNLEAWFVSEEQSTPWTFQAEIMMDSIELGKGKMGDSGASVEQCVCACVCNNYMKCASSFCKSLSQKFCEIMCQCLNPFSEIYPLNAFFFLSLSLFLISRTMNLFTYLFVCRLIYSFIHFICSFVFSFKMIYLSNCLFFHMLIYLFICLFIQLLIDLFIYLIIYLYVFVLFIYLCAFLTFFFSKGGS